MAVGEKPPERTLPWSRGGVYEEVRPNFPRAGDWKSALSARLRQNRNALLWQQGRGKLHDLEGALVPNTFAIPPPTSDGGAQAVPDRSLGSPIRV